MAFLVSDTTGEIVTGSIYLPRSKKVPIGFPVVGVAIAVLKEELATVYGDRFVVEQEQPPSPGPVAVEPTPIPEGKPTARRKAAEGKPAE